MEVNETATSDFMESAQPSETMEQPSVSEHDQPEYPEHYNPDEQAADAPVDINQLDLATEDTGPVDEDKLADRMEFAPSLQPGKAYRFLFALDAEKPVTSRQMKGKTIAIFRYDLTLIKDDGSTGKVVKFNEASMFKSGKMESSRAEELLFALGKLRDYNATNRKPSDVIRLLQEATTEQRTIKGVIQWRRYDKDSHQTWSTAPQKPYEKDEVVNGQKTGNKIHVEELPWPKDAQGKFINRPEEFEGNYGNEVISRVMPEKELLDARKAQQSQQQHA